LLVGGVGGGAPGLVSADVAALQQEIQELRRELDTTRSHAGQTVADMQKQVPYLIDV
jgi:hypothetical protein